MLAILIKLSRLVLLGLLLAGGATWPARAQATWTLANAPTNASWYSLAVPPNGGTLAAAVWGGGIYTSTNGGSSWRQTAAPNQNWYSIACSSNGSTVAAVVWGNGSIYTSTNGGVAWKQTSAPARYWDSVVASYDGRRLAAAASADGIYISTNSGSTWQKTSAPALSWYTLASSSDGGKLAALVYGGGIYTSTNGGSTWNKSAATNAYWGSLACSTDGSKLVAGVYTGGGIYISTNFGSAWIQTSAPDADWLSIASSTSGKILIAGVDGGGVFVSTNSGVDWNNAGAPPANWYSVATSASGSKFLGVVHGGGIYTWQMSLSQEETVDENSATELFLTTEPLDGANFTYAIVSSPTKGSLSGLDTNSGAVTYTPGINYAGSDFFSFSVYDGSFYTTGTVAITITGGNDVSLFQEETVDENTATNLSLITDPLPGTNFTFAIVSGPTPGSLSGLNTSSGAVIYTPALNYTNSDSFRFSVYDGIFYTTGTVAITITGGNDAPVADNQTIAMLEEATTNLVLTATNVDSGNLSFGIVTGPAHGSLSELDANTGAVAYTPAANYRGVDSFTFTVTDSSLPYTLYTTGRVNITITAATNWHSVAMTWAGDFMAVVDFGGGIYTSTNYGGSWEKTSAPDLNWVAVVSDNGLTTNQLTAAAAQGGGIYTSTNRGSSWTKTSAPNTDWVAMVASFDGKKLTAAARGDGIYTSTNAGSGWTKTSATNLNWSALAGTFPGGTLGATAYGNGIYFSTDSGVTWDLSAGTDTEGFNNWSCLTLAATYDTVQLVAAGIAGGGIHNAPDFDGPWFQSSAQDLNWHGIASSETGDFLVAAAEGGIYTSTDSGDFWNLTAAPAADWHAVAVAPDGSKYVAVAYGGAIYISEATIRLNLARLPSTLHFSWTNMAASAGFVLQQNAGLNPAGWVTVDGNLYPPDNSVNPIVQDIPLPATNTFYRLKR